jgi:hypothetical protein
MQEQGTVELTDARTGRVALRMADDSYVLAEQLDAQPLRAGQTLSGAMEVIGTETFTDEQSSLQYGVFIVAYGLSRDAIEQELS